MAENNITNMSYLAPNYTALKLLMTFNQVAIEKASRHTHMMRMNITAIKQKHEMKLKNTYNHNFAQVCRAFIKKY